MPRASALPNRPTPNTGTTTLPPGLGIPVSPDWRRFGPSSTSKGHQKATGRRRDGLTCSAAADANDKRYSAAGRTPARDGRYRTVPGRGEARFEVRGSEFIGHVAPATTVEDAEAFVDAVGEEYADATHNVPAYRVRSDPFREYSCDDGEPFGSSGDPALNVLQQRDIENVVAVVTRYYGGTNLGVGGLASAYSRAVKDGVDDAGVVEEVPTSSSP